MTVIIDDIRLVQTCTACPEQYDAFIGSELVGYLRLRHGFFTVQYPNVEGECVYEAQPKGDGAFYEEEREHFLTSAKEALVDAYEKGK
jgi:hypothetical protein